MQKHGGAHGGGKPNKWHQRVDKITQLLSTLDRMKSPGAEPLPQPDCSFRQAQDEARRRLLLGFLVDADRLQLPTCLAYAQSLCAQAVSGF